MMSSRNCDHVTVLFSINFLLHDKNDFSDIEKHCDINQRLTETSNVEIIKKHRVVRLTNFDTKSFTITVITKEKFDRGSLITTKCSIYLKSGLLTL